MLRSKKISDYLPAPFDEVRADVRLPVDVHLYFLSNRHIIIWRKNGEIPTDKFLNKYRKRGISQVWIHRDDLALWQQYAQNTVEASPPAASAPELSVEAAPAAPQAPGESLAFAVAEELAALMEGAPAPAPIAEARTAEGREITEVLGSDELSERHKTALVARAARELLAETARPIDPAEQALALRHAREAVRDVLDAALESAPPQIRNAINEIWDLSSLEAGLDHAIHVATYAVLFSMAFGRINQELMADIALAALLHDAGLTQIPYQAVQTPWTHQKGRLLQLYSRHVDEGIRLLDELAPGMSPRIRPLIQQHHEKFDGTGYPLQLQGFQVNDIAQLVGMADSIESMASGQWDGKRRSFMETLETLEALEKSHELPEYFNPEVFSAVIRWVRTKGALSQQLKASDVVRSTTRDLMKRAN